MHTKEMLPLPVKPRARASYVHRGIPRVTVPPPEIKHLPSMYRPRPVTVVKSHVVSTKPKQENKPKQVAAGKVTAAKPRRNAKPRRKLALLLPGHNEELIISTTIRSAVAAGQNKRDIFVVDDASTDATRRLAVELLGKQNVLSVHRSGKALAVKKAIKKFNIERQYQWLHVADADSIFSPDYFRIYRRKLDSSKYAVAVGFVQSLRGNWISTYRALTYTFSQHVNRRIQAKLGMISVFPGPITCFRTDILSKLDFEADSMTEDVDITLQVHRKKLGNIVFIPRAINYTQDPQTLKDFCKQTQRWQRGFFQGVRKYRIGLHGQRIDLSLGFQMLQTILFIVQLGILFPLIIFTTHNWMIIPVAIAADFVLNSAIAVGASVAAKRWMLLGALPYFYFLRWVEIGIYLSAFVEVIILGRFKQSVKGWATEGRRYKLDMAALQDVAQ
jgi:biofilm PGA synthesis N-glycosyltransferase PgaC